jgi:hypothetical protein
VNIQEASDMFEITPWPATMLLHVPDLPERERTIIKDATSSVATKKI